VAVVLRRQRKFYFGREKKNVVIGSFR
jgi:hypothetical protein